MVRGFYAAASGMLTQSKNLNTISNNLANVSTAGYKKDTLASTTFGQTLLAKTGNIYKNTTNIGTVSMIVTPQEIYTNHTQGVLERTDRQLDMAISGQGFFTINNGTETIYTRNGSFTIDNDGYLVLQNIGRVMGENGPIKLTGDNVVVREDGSIYSNGVYNGTLNIVDFEDYNALYKTSEGVFTTNQQPVNTNASIYNNYVERANVESSEELTDMIVSQRSLQSCSQMLKMHDELLEKAISEIGKV